MKKLILAALVLLSVESFAQTHVVQGSVFVFDSLKVTRHAHRCKALCHKTFAATDAACQANGNHRGSSTKLTICGSTLTLYTLAG